MADMDYSEKACQDTYNLGNIHQLSKTVHIFSCETSLSEVDYASILGRF